MTMLFGQINSETGDIVADTTVCILTGRVIEPGDMMVRISGTPYFYRVSAGAVKDLTADVREAIEAEAQKSGPFNEDEAANNDAAESEG